MKKKFIIVLDGPMGSGKSTVGAMLHEKLKRTAILNTDKIKWFLSDFKRGRKDNKITYAVLFKMAEEYLNQGISLIIPQGFWKGGSFVTPSYLAALAKKYKADFYFYQLDAPKELLLKRIGKRKTEARTPIAQSRVLRNLRMWKAHRFPSNIVFETDKLTADKITKQILIDIKK